MRQDDDQDSPNGALTRELAAVWKATGEAARTVDVKDQLRARRVPARFVRWPSAVPLAAAAAVVVCAVALTWYLAARRSTEQPFREFATGAGGHATVLLRDGTRLVLGPVSHVRVPRDFGVRDRTVDLTGEAEFAVTHDAAHPFAVRTLTSTVRDIGTVFVVRQYLEDSSESIAVSEGEVSLNARVLLGARDAAVVDPLGRITVRRDMDVAPYFAWMQGGLTFDRTPFAAAVREIERVYGVNITVADTSFLTLHITASLASASVDDALEAVTRAIGAQYERTGRAVSIRPRVRKSDGNGEGQRPLLQTANRQKAGV